MTSPPRGENQAGSAVVARIPYLNSLPYYLRWDQLGAASNGEWRSVDLPPRQLGLAAERGDVHAGLMAVADVARLEGRFEPIYVDGPEGRQSLGIANRGRVDSVLLFVREELLQAMGGVEGMDLPASRMELLHDRLIALTDESSTSVRLLRLLLEARGGIRPRYARNPLDGNVPASADAALVIGDRALRWRAQPPAGFRQAMDLAWAWHAWTSLPFTFARWVVRTDVSPERRAWLGRFLADSLDGAAPRYEELVSNLPADLGSASVLVAFLRNFTYRLGPDEERAASRYEELLRQHELVHLPFDSPVERPSSHPSRTPDPV